MASRRVYLFRLQILIIDGGLLVLRNILDQKLNSLCLTFDACVNSEKPTITHLRSRGVITNAQHDILFPAGGKVPSTSDLDVTLIICLLRGLRCFGLNRRFDWKVTPNKTDVSTEADIWRLKDYRNNIAHIPSTTVIQETDFKTWWKDIEQILLRLSSSHSLNIHPTIAGYETCSLDEAEEERIRKEMEKLEDFEAKFDRLHGEVKTLQSDVSEMKGDISKTKDDKTEMTKNVTGVKDEVTRMKDEVTGVKEEVTGVIEDVTEMKDDVTGMKEEVTGVNENVSVMKKEVTGVKNDITEMKDHITVVKEDITGFKEEVTGVKEEVIVVQKNITGVKDNMTGVKDYITGVKEEVTGVKEEVTVVQKNITGVKDDITGVKDYITGVKEEVTGVNEEITGVKEEVTVVQKDITGVKDDITGVKEEVTGVKEEVTGVKEEVTGVKEEVTVVQKDITGVKDDITGVKDGVTGVKEEVTGVKEEVTGVKEEVTVVQKDITGVKDDITGVKDYITGVKEEVTDVKEEATGIKEEVTGVKEEVTVVQKDITGVKDDITGVKDYITGVKEEVTDVKEEVTGVKEEVTGVKEEVTVVQKDITGVKGDITGVKNDVTGVQNEVTRVKKEATGVKKKVIVVQEDITGVKKEVTGVKEDITGMMKGLNELKNRQDAKDENIKAYTDEKMSTETDEDYSKHKRDQSNQQKKQNKSIWQKLMHRIRYRRKKKELKEKMMKFYKEKRSTIPLSPLLEEEETNLAGFYVMPKMFYIKQKSRTSHEEERTPVSSLSDLLITGSNVQQKIYLSADAGFGKTSFSKYLAITWSQARCPDKNRKSFSKEEIKALSNFDFLFLILLRDCTDVCSVDDMIEQQIIKKLSGSQYPIQEILDREKCLIILDGLDEWTHSVKECPDKDEKIPHRYARDNCVILTTTRPWKLGVLNLKTNDINKKVELVKLSEDLTYQLEKNAISKMSGVKDEGELKEKTTKFHQDIVSRGLENMHTIPLLLMYITCLWCNKIPIGNSKVEVYINIIEYLLSRTVRKHPDVHRSSETSRSDIPEFFKKSTCQERNCQIPKCEEHKHKYCQEFYSVLRALTKLAYHTLYSENRENTLVFDQCVAEKYLAADDMKLSLLSGILTGSTTRTLMEQSSKVSFSHKTVQEFFAALFISSQSDGQKQVLEKCTNVQSILDMSMICEFLSKMNSKMMYEILPGLMSVINEDEETRNYRTRTDYVYYRNEPLYNIHKMLVLCLKQMLESENIKLCLQDFFIDKDTIDDEHLQRLSKQNQTNMKSLYMYMNDTDSSLHDVIPLFSLTDSSNLQTLRYYGDDKEEEFSLLLSENLQHVKLYYAEWTNYEGSLCKRITALKHVQYFHISHVTLSHEILSILYDFISNNKTIKQLTLESLSCKEHGDSYDCTGNFELSIKHSQLERLDLHSLSPLNLTLTSQSLVHVELWDINLGKSSLLLSHDMFNIKRVKLVGIEISAEIFRDFINVIENLPQSVTVKMSRIEPRTEYKLVRKYIRSSQKFVVTQDEILNVFGWHEFVFQNTTRSSTTTTTRSARAIQETPGSARN